MDLLQTADEQGKPLYFMVPHPWAASFKVPKLWRLFNESGLFTGYLYFRGLDQTNDRVVAQLSAWERAATSISKLFSAAGRAFLIQISPAGISK